MQRCYFSFLHILKETCRSSNWYPLQIDDIYYPTIYRCVLWVEWFSIPYSTQFQQISWSSCFNDRHQVWIIIWWEWDALRYQVVLNYYAIFFSSAPSAPSRCLMEHQTYTQRSGVLRAPLIVPNEASTSLVHLFRCCFGSYSRYSEMSGKTENEHLETWCIPYLPLVWCVTNTDDISLPDTNLV